MSRPPLGQSLAELLTRELAMIVAGNVDDMSPRLRQRVHRNVSGCIEWHGSRDENGYGLIHWKGSTGRVTRVMWEIVHGVTLSREIFLCHHCDNPPCLNIEHLFLGTSADNIRDSQGKGRFPYSEKTRKRKRQTFGQPLVEGDVW